MTIIESGIIISTTALTIVAVIDPSITSIILAIIAAAVVIIPLWFKFKTDAMNTRLKEQDIRIEGVIKTSDGLKSELVAMTEKAGIAKGVAIGKEQAEAKAAVVTEAKAAGVVEGIAQAQRTVEQENKL